MHFWKPLFSKTSGFQKTDKKICVHVSIFISYLAVHNRDWKWRSKDAFCYQAMLEQFLCPNTHAWCPKTLKACQISFAHVKVKHAHDYDITPFWKPPFFALHARMIDLCFQNSPLSKHFWKPLFSRTSLFIILAWTVIIFFFIKVFENISVDEASVYGLNVLNGLSCMPLSE